MKKILLSTALIVVATVANSQTLMTENFETLTVGNVSADATGLTPGQGGWSINGPSVADFQIISSGTDKDLQITGAAGDATSSRYMWKDGLAALWAARTPGNNIIQIEYDFFTGPTSTSKNTVGMELYNTAYAKYLGGFRMRADTKVLNGIYTTAAGINPSLVNLGATPVVLPANQWVRVGWAYNSTTGLITFKGPGFEGTIAGAVSDIYELDFTMENFETTGNTSSFNALFDNLAVRAVAAVNLLGTSEATLKKMGISVSPNPTADYLRVDSKARILNTYIYDLSGIRMDAKMVDGKIDVRSLPVGNYILGLKTEEGMVSKKFIKK
ncbi:T9SS type A sorting domain-containing protein [Marnyiella aurantia]|uniref:T9SS type A sorting domain-containing protein n=1 Tax=Marnyiella aurantia TaxID=2758037 RepID=A0A7D7LTI1_9FLAO|nr:T9SS type A sorting domain-containing protein [Marnyiella aurantia]MBA5246252.1 T9SS type A sorting domain-containing protein [Marnyiella aurantia]QMS98373.1 T9SS type A sorting domain-containing protein [Marnyiella aurantia]